MLIGTFVFYFLQFKHFEFGVRQQKAFPATAATTTTTTTAAESASIWSAAIPIEFKSITDELIVTTIII